MIIEPEKGQMFYQIAEYACKLAKERQTEVQFKFNDIYNHVSPDSCVGDICIIYDLRNQLRIIKK